MQRIVLNQYLRTGNRYIDLQHQDLIDIINDFGEALARHASMSEVQTILVRLAQYVQFHFKHEEREIVRNSLDGVHAEAHSAQHREFERRVQTAIDTLGESGLLTTKDAQALLRYLESWLTSHIAHTDKQLASRLRAATSKGQRSGGRS